MLWLHGEDRHICGYNNISTEKVDSRAYIPHPRFGINIVTPGTNPQIESRHQPVKKSCRGFPNWPGLKNKTLVIPPSTRYPFFVSGAPLLHFPLIEPCRNLVFWTISETVNFFEISTIYNNGNNSLRIISVKYPQRLSFAFSKWSTPKPDSVPLNYFINV